MQPGIERNALERLLYWSVQRESKSYLEYLGSVKWMRASNLASFLRMDSFVFCHTTDLFLVCKIRLWPRANSLHQAIFRSLSHFMLLKSSVICKLGVMPHCLVDILRFFFLRCAFFCQPSSGSTLRSGAILIWFVYLHAIRAGVLFHEIRFWILTLLVVSFASSLIWFSHTISLLR